MLVKERPVKSLIHEGKEKRKQSIKRSKVKVARQVVKLHSEEGDRVDLVSF